MPAPRRADHTPCQRQFVVLRPQPQPAAVDDGLLARNPARGVKVAALMRELAPRMGQIELSADGKPVKGSDRFSAAGTISFTGNYTFADATGNGMSDPWETERFGSVVAVRLGDLVRVPPGQHHLLLLPRRGHLALRHACPDPRKKCRERRIDHPRRLPHRGKL